ncbi:MAG: histidinol-phosphatase HisJ [Promethearchaeota archaeon]
MILEDWHTHSERCHHAVGDLEDYAIKGIEKKLQTIGFSDHFPYEFLKKIDRIPYGEYAMTLEEIEDYLSTAEKLREKYKEKIAIKIAFEVDFFENQEQALKFQLRKVIKRLDYILGSIHILDFKDGRGSWGFDDGRFLKDYQYYGADAVYLQYYKTEQQMLNSKDFDLDIIGHFDLPKKFNNLPENKEEVFNEAMKTLELIKKKDLTMEINTSGFRKEVGKQYPSLKIIKKMYALDIPVLLGSDAHDPAEVAWEFEKTIELLKTIGYDHLAHFNKRKRSEIEI